MPTTTNNSCHLLALIFNVVFLLLGLTTMITASIIVQDEVGKLSGHGISTGLLLIGASIIVVSALGTQASCLGKLQEWSFMYAVILTFCLVTTVILCSVVFQEATVKENLSAGWVTVDLEVKRTVQTSLQCCGFNKIHDRSILPCNYVEPCEPILHTMVDARMSSMRGCVFALLSFEAVGLCIAIATWCQQVKTPVPFNAYGSGAPETTRSSSNKILFHANGDD